MDEEKSLWPGRIGLVFATIAAVIWSIVSALPDAIKQYAPDIRTGDYAGFAGAVTGHIIVIAAVVFAILYVALLRGADASRGIRYFLTIFFVTIAADAGIVVFAKNAAAQHKAEYRAALTDMGRMVQIGKSKDKKAAVLGFQIHATGEAGIVEGIIKNEMLTLVRLRSQYHAELLALGLQSALTPSRLAADGGVKDARRRLAASRALVKKYRDAEMKVVLIDTRAAIAKAHLPDVLAGFDRSAKGGVPMLEEIWNDEDGILAESDAMVQDLARASWKLRGEMIVFSSQGDLQTYQAHRLKIHQLAQDERDTIVQSQAKEAAKLRSAAANLN